MPPLLCERGGAVLTLTLDRPEARNAFDEDLVAAVTRALRSASKDPSLRAVVLRGAGRDFCAGADIRMMRRAAGYPPAKNKADARRIIGMCRAVDDCPVPVLARVQGACLGGALGLAAAADIAVAADTAEFAFPECRLGIVPAVISSFVVPKIGPSQARRYFLTSETFGAEAARAMGLVHEVAPEADLDARLGAHLRSILRTGPKASRAAKALLRRTAGPPADRRRAFAVDLLARVRAGDEAREGLAAFLEKRRASWVVEPPKAE